MFLYFKDHTAKVTVVMTWNTRVPEHTI